MNISFKHRSNLYLKL